MIQLIIYFLTALLTYLASRGAGLSKGKAALVAGAVTGGAYLAGVGDKVADFFAQKGVAPGDATVEAPSSTPGTSPGLVSGAIGWLAGNKDTIVKGATTVGAVAGAAVLGKKIVASKWFPWVLGGLGLWFLMGGRDD